MSIDIYSFLGPDVQNLEQRFIQAFASIGFRVQLHPEIGLLESNPSGCLFLSILDVPSQVKRIACDVPLLVGFGYQVERRTKNISISREWKRRKIESYTYEICTRTSSGRSVSAYFMQALSAAILANETNGYFYINGDDEAKAGRAGLDLVLGELNSISAEEFDSNGYPFESWPPIDPSVAFLWPKPIVSSFSQPRKLPSQQRKRYKLSVFEMFGYLILLAFVVITFIYS